MKTQKKLLTLCIIMMSLFLCLGRVFAAQCGDVNSGGSVDIVDALLIAQYYVGLNPSNFAIDVADVNGDGSIDIIDGLRVAQFYVGLASELSCGNANQDPIFSGGPYTLNGTSEYVDLPDGLTNDLGDFSVAAWVNVSSLVNWTRIFDFGGDSNVFMMLTPISGNTGYPYFCITTSGNSGEQGINGTSAFPIGSWHHIAVTKSGTTGILYIDKQEVGRNAGIALNPSDLGNTTNNYIGRSQWSQDPYLAASIDQFVVYARAISASEVTALGNNPPANVTPIPTAIPTTEPTVAPTPSTGSRFHCFLLLGQSNMAGYAQAQAADKTEDSRIRVLGFDECSATGRLADQWDVACPPLHDCWNSAVGPGDWFGKTMIAEYPEGDTIGLIPCAISGEKIETFMKVGGSKYSWIVNRARIAQQAGGIIDGIIFHQGESNSGQSDWPQKVKTLITDLRNDLVLGDVPFLPGELLYSGPCAGHNTLVNQLPTIITNCYIVSASGLVVDPADTAYRLHFDHDSTVTFGKRYAQVMISALQL